MLLMQELVVLYVLEVPYYLPWIFDAGFFKSSWYLICYCYLIDDLGIRYLPHLISSDLPSNPGINGTALYPSADLEVPQANPNILLRLVSEGNLDGVRLVCFNIDLCHIFWIWNLLLWDLFSITPVLCREFLAKTASGHNGNLLHSLLEAQNAEGQTALHLACRRGSVELVEAILEYKESNVDVLDKDGDPPLVFALAAGSPECVRALISRDANVRSRLREGLGPSVAHVCAYHGQPDCMRVSVLEFCKLIGYGYV